MEQHTGPQNTQKFLITQQRRVMYFEFLSSAVRKSNRDVRIWTGSDLNFVVEAILNGN